MAASATGNPIRLTHAVTSSLYASGPLAFEFWINVRSNPDTGPAVICNFRSTSDPGTSKYGRAVYVSFPTASTFYVHALVNTNGGVCLHQTDAALNCNQWYHVIVVHQAAFGTVNTAARIIINGSVVASTGGGSTGTVYAPNDVLEWFDRAGGSDRQLTGLIEGARFWARDISGAEGLTLRGTRTAAQVAALPFASSLLGQAEFIDDINYVEYASGYPEASTISGTQVGTGAVALSDRTYIPRARRGLCGRWRAGAGRWTDAGTTPVSATGDQVYQWDDRSLCGNTGTQTTADNRPRYVAASGVLTESIAFDPSSAGQFFDCGSSGTRYGTQNSVAVMVGRFGALGERQTTVLGGSSFEAVIGTDCRMRASGTSVAIDGCASPSFYAWAAGASEFRAYRDTLSAAGAAITSASGQGTYIGRRQAASDSFMVGYIQDLLVFQDPDLDATGIAELYSSIAVAGYGITTKTDDVIGEGTSSMAGFYYGAFGGTNQTLGQDIFSIMQASLPRVRFFNVAEGGETISNSITDRAIVQNIVSRQVALTGKTPAAILWVGSNDIYVSGDTPATVSTNIDTLIGYYAGYGITKIGLITILPRGTVGSADNDDRVAYNALLKAKGRRVADPASDSRLQDGAQTSTTYYTSGEASPRTHLNFTGMSIVAGYVANVVRGLIGSGGFRNRARTFGMRDR